MRNLPNIWTYLSGDKRLEIQTKSPIDDLIGQVYFTRHFSESGILYDIKELLNINFEEVWKKIKTEYSDYYNNIDFPTIIWEGTSFTCQLKCPTCRHKVIVDKKDKEELWEYITPILNDNRVKSILVGCNGDAFVDKNRIQYFRNLTTEVLEHKFSIQACTNGLALTEKMWNSFGDLKKYPGKLDITISLDAATKDTYNINRVLGDWDLINENLKFLSTLNLGQLNIDMTIQKNNYKEMVDFVKLGNSLNINTSLRAMNNWYWEEDRYIDNAVHLKEHSLYDDFKKELDRAIEFGAFSMGELR